MVPDNVIASVKHLSRKIFGSVESESILDCMIIRVLLFRPILSVNDRIKSRITIGFIHLERSDFVAYKNTQEMKLHRQYLLLLTPWTVSAFSSHCATFLRPSSLDASMASGDNVLVVGGTGGVGQLITKKLLAGGFGVRISSRNVERGEETIGDDRVQVCALDLIQDDVAAMENAMQGMDAIVISVGTTAFPTLKWKGGNTPEAIDQVAVTRLAKAAASVGLKKIILLTSVGVERTKEMPFLILNLFGVLDAKKAGEEAVKASGVDYAIVRPGRLVGGPYTNLDLAKLMQIEGGAENGVSIELGDVLLGDAKRDAVAEAVLQALLKEECSNIEFSIISNNDKALTDEEWTREFSRMAAVQ